MADIHHLPLAGLGGTGIRRLTRDLKAQFGAGDGLGSRIAHIHAYAHALDELSDRLEANIAVLTDLAGAESVSGLALPAAIDALQQLANECRALSRRASTLPRTSPLDPTGSPKPHV